MDELRAVIAGRILAEGPISFAAYMDLALYHPTLGYYARAARRTGRAGDFFTSVDVGPVFGELLAVQLAEMWRILSPHDSFDLVEAGAGNGRLACDVLNAAREDDHEFYKAIRLHLVERSPAARAAHATTLREHAERFCSSGAAIPPGVNGAILANELLDALPTHVVVMTEAGLREVFVDEERGRLVERLRPPTDEIPGYLSRAGAALLPGWRSEVNLESVDWVKASARALSRGFLIVIDYGHQETELYGPSHSAGTLTPFHRHTTSPPSGEARGAVAACLADPGECDITAHVDLSAITRAAEEEGLSAVARLDQTYFLLGLGLDDILGQCGGSDRESLRRRLTLKTLMMPGGLGSTHKVLIFGKGVGVPRLKGCAFRERLTL